MRKILYILFLPLLCACDNMLNVEPENAITFTNYFKTEEDFDAIVFEMNSLFRFGLFQNEVMAYRGSMADKVVVTTYQDQRMFNQTSIVDVFFNDWRNHYDVIYLANVILDNLHRQENVSRERLDFYTGQACFVKGFTYFDLARKWGEAVITKSSTDMRIYGKSTMMEVIDEALRNALEGYKLLPKHEDLPKIGNNAWMSKQYGSKGNCTALLAHIYAWKGSIIELYGLEGNAKECYGKSNEWCSLLIEGKVGNYALELTTEDVCVKAMKGMGESSESILEFELDEFITRPMAYFPGRQTLSWPVNATKQPGDLKNTNFQIKAETVKSLYENKDHRREEYFYKLDSMSHDTMRKVNDGFAYVYKWREAKYKMEVWSPAPLFGYYYANYTYWRLSDIYLLRAENYAKLNNAAAEDDLNEIRKRANATFYPASGEQDIQYAVFRERERELLFEGHRYFDIIRNGLEYINTRLNGNFMTLSLQDIKEGALYLPVHETAFTLNDLIRQNVYWKRFE